MADPIEPKNRELMDYLFEKKEQVPNEIYVTLTNMVKKKTRVVRAHFLCAQQRFAHARAPAHPGRAVRGRGGDSDAAAAPCAQEHFVFDFGD